MFTGIIRTMGSITQLQKKGKILQFWLKPETGIAGIKTGDSIAVDGVCQTLVSHEGEILSFEAVDETLSKTTLGELKIGQKVHLEPSLKLSDPLDGHLVSGHVDGVGQITKINSQSGRYDLSVKVPPQFSKYLLKGGSIALSGVSLTIFDVVDDTFSVTLIPETLKRTHLEKHSTGGFLNIEVDMVGKWIEKLLPTLSDPGKLTQKLQQWGYAQK